MIGIDPTSVTVGPPQPGDIGWLIGLHGRWFSKTANFGPDFEAKVALVIADIASRLDPPRVSILIARDSIGPVATVTADLDDCDADGRGHIRLVIAEERARRQGITLRLFREAIAGLREAGAPGAFVDTFAGLDAARELYLAAGFQLIAEAHGSSWGPRLMEQCYVVDFEAAPGA